MSEKLFFFFFGVAGEFCHFLKFFLERLRGGLRRWKQCLGEGSDRVNASTGVLPSIIDCYWLSVSTDVSFFRPPGPLTCTAVLCKRKEAGHRLIDIRPAHTCTRLQKGRGTLHHSPPGKKEADPQHTHKQTHHSGCPGHFQNQKALISSVTCRVGKPQQKKKKRIQISVQNWIGMCNVSQCSAIKNKTPLIEQRCNGQKASGTGKCTEWMSE